MTLGSASGVADDLELDPVPVHEIEAAARVVIAVGEGDEAGGDHPLLDRVEIVDLDADMVEWRALRPATVPVLAGLGIDGEIIGVVADMDDAAAVAGRALPADVPANKSSSNRADRSGWLTVMFTCSMKPVRMTNSFSIRVMLEASTTSS